MNPRRLLLISLPALGVVGAISVACSDAEGPLFVPVGAPDAAKIDSAPPDGGIPVDDASDASAACTSSTNTSANAEHCGRCFHSCGGGTCVEGKCQAMLLATSPTPFGVTVFQDRVYWGRRAFDALGGGVRSVRIDGSDLQISPGTPATINGIHVDALGALYTDHGNGQIWQSSGLMATPTLRHSQGGPGAQEIVADNVQILWTDLYAPGLFRATRTGSEPAVNLGPSPHSLYPFGIALSGDYVYWTNLGSQAVGPDAGAPDGTILRTKKDGTQSTPTPIATGLRQPVYLALDDIHVYFADAYANGLFRVPRDGGAVEKVAELSAPYGVALDADFAYATEFGSGTNGRVIRVAKNGTGSLEVMATNLVMPTKVVVDDRFVYWANQAGGTVMKVAKP